MFSNRAAYHSQKEGIQTELKQLDIIALAQHDYHLTELQGGYYLQPLGY